MNSERGREFKAERNRGLQPVFQGVVMCPEAAEPDDSQLMHRIGRGDEIAFAALMERHSAALLAFISRTLGSASAAEDLTQDCFLRVFRAAPKYQPSARFRTWLFTIAMNVCRNHHRARGRRPERSLEELTSRDDGPRMNVASDDDGPRGDLEREELRRRVRCAVEGLPAQQRVALVLARYEGLSLVEISQVMGNSVMAVKSLLNRARENLRQTLERDLEDHLTVLEGRSGG